MEKTIRSMEPLLPPENESDLNDLAIDLVSEYSRAIRTPIPFDFGH